MEEKYKDIEGTHIGKVLKSGVLPQVTVDGNIAQDAQHYDYDDDESGLVFSAKIVFYININDIWIEYITKDDTVKQINCKFEDIQDCSCNF